MHIDSIYSDAAIEMDRKGQTFARMHRLIGLREQKSTHPLRIFLVFLSV